MKSKKNLLSYGLVLSFFLLISHRAESSEDSLYDFLWLDPDKSVYVLQNKTYKKAGTFFGEINGLMVVGDEFVDGLGGALKVGYYFNETFGVAASYTQYENSFSENWDNVKRVSSVEPFVRQFNSVTTLELLYTPFYGKVNTFNKIYYFDWGFGVGLAQIDAESNLNSVFLDDTPTTFGNENFTGLIYKTDFKFHINRSFYLNLELRNISYSGENNPNDKSAKELQTHTDFLFGIGFKF